jgi:methyl-accepting chemotaxis protein
MFKLGSLSIARRLGLLVGSAVLGILVLASSFLISERSLILEERKSSVRQTVETVHGLLVHFHDQVNQGKLSDEEARLRAVESIKGLRYSGNEYFWINDMHATMVMHPIKPELDGKDLSGIKDPTGKQLFVAFVDKVKANGSGYVFYMWPKPGSAQPVQKVSYVQGFEPWGWVIGSGVYIDTVDATILGRVLSMSAGSLLLGVILLGIGLVIARDMLRQLGGEPAYAAKITKDIADGDLSIDIQLNAGDRSSLLHAMKSMRDGLSGMVGCIRTGSESVASASFEIARANMDLSQRTEEQASALEETAASMEQLSATVKLNAENAGQANRLAQGASTVAAAGGDIVGQAVETMRGINDSSKRIADIIGVIDGIAFQTNILALNAAVEAARAGEQGRGFAVVASEVRSLAGRSAEAAREIKILINDSVQRVGQGTIEIDKAGATMTEVVSSIRQLTDIMGEISAASSEQSQGVAQVGQAVTQMDQATQQNAALVEETAAAAEGLKLRARELVQVVEVFKLA